MEKMIAHISDIHIRFSRQEEYRIVFNNLYSKLEEKSPDLIVVTGDIGHTGANLLPEQIDLFREFISNLSFIAKVLIIPGNHDGLVRNASRMDALTPIINSLNDDNIVYLKDSGKYEFDDEIDFYHVSVFDKDFNIQVPDNKDKTNIFLYHGTIEGCILQNGRVIEQSKLKKEMLGEYDIAMLGDIHKEQTMFYNNCVIRQAGSLIQQNFGEDILGHGFTMWTINDKKVTYKHIEIASDYKLYNVRFEDDEIVSDINIDDVVIKPSFKIRYSNTKIITIENFLSKFRDVQKVYLEDSSIKKLSIDNEIDKQIIDDVEYQNKVIEDSKIAPDDKLVEIKELNKIINEKTTRDDFAKSNIWRIKRLKFRNLFSFSGDIDNEIDFDKLTGLIGIFGKNFQGKSSIFNIISYVAFDKCEKSGLIRDIVNYDSNDFYSEIEIEIGGVSYFIKRYGERKEKTFPVTVEFYKIENGEKIDLTGSQRRDTNKNITNLIGTYDDFVLTTFSVQNDFTGVLKMRQSELKDMLYRFFNLEYFDKLLKIAKEDLKELEVLYKRVESEDYDNKISFLLDENKNKEEEIKSLRGRINNILTNRSILEGEIETLTSKLPNIEDVKDINLNTTKYEKEITEDKISKLNNDYDVKTQQISEIESNIKETYQELKESKKTKEEERKELQNSLLQEISLVDVGKLKDSLLKEESKDFKLIDSIKEELSDSKYDIDESLFEKLNTYIDELKGKDKLSNRELDSLKQERSLIKANISTNKDISQKLDTIEYDDNCPYCLNFVKDYTIARDKLKNLELDLVNVEEKIQKKEDETGELSKTLQDKINEYLSLKEIARDKAELEKELNYLESDRKETLKRIDDLKEDILNGAKSNEKSLKIKEANKEIRKSIEEIDKKIESIDKSIDDYLKLERVKNERDSIQNKINGLVNEVKELDLTIQKFLSKKDEVELYDKISNEIKEKKQTLSLHQIDYDKLLKQIYQEEASISHNIKSVDDITNLIKERANLLEKVRLYQIYCKVVDKNGLPYHIIKTVIPSLENDANKILEGISGYRLIFELDDSNINIYINYDGNLWNIATASGMERFAASIALRVALSNNTNLSRGNFLMIDEGFSTLDSEHLVDVSKMLKEMNLYFEKIFIISHLEFINEIVDNKLIVARDENGISQINM